MRIMEVCVERKEHCGKAVLIYQPYWINFE
jgi:hypothetical protein